MAADAFDLRLIDFPIVSLGWLGTLPGVFIAKVAGLNGPGVGRLRAVGTSLAWRAPGSQSFGLAVQASVDGTYTLTDGEDSDKWVRVTVAVAHLIDKTVNVYLEETYAGNFLVTDFPAASVAAGIVNTHTLRIFNAGSFTFEDVRVWLTPLNPALAISGMAGCVRRSASDGGRRLRGGGVLPLAAVNMGVGFLGPRRRRIERSRFGSERASGYVPLSARTAYTVEISSDNVNFYAPREEYAADTLVYGPIAPGAYSNLYVRRTIPAGMAADPRGRTDLQFSFGIFQ